MRGKRFTEEQIIAVLKEAEAGAKTPDLCRRHGVSEQTFYRWKARYGGLEVSDLRRLRQLEDENSRLKRLVADLTLDNQALKELIQKRPDARNAARGGAGAHERVRTQRTPGLSAGRPGALDLPVPSAP
jgi:putative transposase